MPRCPHNPFFRFFIFFFSKKKKKKKKKQQQPKNQKIKINVLGTHCGDGSRGAAAGG
jgi:hypothetical protein